jgi:phosphoribosylamine--glycine ligase
MDDRVNVLVIGKGGREHALVWKLAQSPRAGTIYCAPGNAGTAIDGVNVPIDTTDFPKVIAFAKKENIGLTVVGPEDPLTLGIVDAFQAAGLRIFGPTKAAARLEGSKVFAKQLMRHADVATADFRIFDHPDPARTYVESREYPVVVKADGLAAGKGVIVCKDSAEALKAIERIMVRDEFGQSAGRRIVIEKRLDGDEFSLMALVSGRAILPLPLTQDHKAAFDGDTGPNTGGMGAFCPASLATPELMKEAEETILIPIVHALRRARTPFRGLLYAGLMATSQGLRVLEFNVRFGDPETQPLLMRYRGDLIGLLEAVVDDRLLEFVGDGLDWDTRAAVSVVLASQGYPGQYPKGRVITGLEAAAAVPNVQIFHAGTVREADHVLTDGGRVLAVTAVGNDLFAARSRAYTAVEKIRFTGMHYRKDIGQKAMRAASPDPDRPAVQV